MGKNPTVYLGDDEYDYAKQFQEEEGYPNFSNAMRALIREHLALRLKAAEEGWEIDIDDPQAWQYSDEKMLEDIRRVADELGDTPSKNEYNSHGEYYIETIQRRFGTWTAALEDAGLELTRHPDEGGEEEPSSLEEAADQQMQNVREQAKAADQEGGDD